MAQIAKNDAPSSLVETVPSARLNASRAAPSSEEPNTVVCLECGGHYGSLSRHLGAAHRLSVRDYRAKHGAEALIYPSGVKPGPKRKTPAPSHPAKIDLSNLPTDATSIDLIELGRIARDGMTFLDAMFQDALVGRSDIARQTFAIGYEFARRCVADSAAAEKLPRYQDAEVQAGSNPYYRPLKYLALDVISKELTSALTQWAAIYRDADTRGLTAVTFVDELKRVGGRRNWYDALVAPRKGKGGKKKGKDASIIGVSQDESTQPLSGDDARAFLASQGFSDPTAGAVETLDAKSAAALLAAQGAQLGPDKLTQDEGRKLFPAPQSLVLWRADILPSVKAMLETMDGFVRILNLTQTEVSAILEKLGNDQ